MSFDAAGRYRLYGVLGSPYVAKLRALFRYRHIPFDYLPATFDWAPSFQLVRPELRDVRPRIVPVVWFPSDRQFHVDSSVIARMLESLHPHRSAVPDSPALSFLSSLLEDFGDEWLVKVAFQYRWGSAEDRNLANRHMMGELLGGRMPSEAIHQAAIEFRDRQVSRMPLVGCTPENLPVLAQTYRRVLDAMDALRQERPFVFGSRPSLGDFGLFGALFSCRNDPTPAKIMRAQSPATLDWVAALDEASGVQGDWLADAAALGPGVRMLLDVIGQAYLPFLRENLIACENAKAEVKLDIFGAPYRQAPFRYQAKCLRELQREFAQLPGAAREQLQRLLRDSGCLEVLDDAR